MLEFKKIELSDKEWIEELLSYSDFRGCEYCFGNNYIWRDIFDVTIARYKDFYICRQGKGFVFPAGKGDVKEVIDELIAFCESEGTEFQIISMDNKSKELLCSLYPDAFEFTTNPDLYDYVYSAEALRTLSGKKLHSKRNYINRFKNLDWSFEEINESNINECKEMSLEWCRINNCECDEGKAEEICAVNNGLANFSALGFKGGLIRVNGVIKAFSYGEIINKDTFVTHVEKAFTDVDGTYPMINYMIANTFCKELEYINREEDMGEENLRKAKKSYHPVFMLEKHKANYKN